MRKNIIGSLVTLAFVAVLLTPQAHAETVSTTNTAAIEQIKMLMAKLQELQEQMAAIRGEINDVLTSNITEGTSSDDIKKVQELLATDAQIYPEGQVTGYFGPRTKEAIKKFQERHGLPVTGVVDEETKSLLSEYLKEKQGDRIPPGLLGAPGMMKKVEDRFKMRCDNRGPGKGVGPLCERLKMHDQNHDMDEDEDDDNSASSTDESSDSDSKTATQRDAAKALLDAGKDISEAVKEIRKADGETAEAEEILAKARTTLSEARKAMGNRAYNDAVAKADEASELANEAENLAKESAVDDTDDSVDEDEDEDE